MQADASSARPAIPERVRGERGLRHGVIASVLLHAGLALAIGRVVTTPLPPSDDAARPSLQVTVVTRIPRIAESRQDEATDLQRESEFAEASVIASEASVIESEASVIESTELPPPSANIEIPAAETQEAALTDTSANPSPATSDEASAPVLDIGRLQESIRGTTRLYRRDTLDQQMDACREYRERYARWDCPKDKEVKTAMQEAIDTNMQATFRAWTYGHSENERISRELLADMDALRPLLDDPGVLGEVARTRYTLKSEQYALLNPPGSGGGGVVTIIALGVPGLVILNGLLTIGFDGKVRVRDEQLKGPARQVDE